MEETTNTDAGTPDVEATTETAEATQTAETTTETPTNTTLLTGGEPQKADADAAEGKDEPFTLTVPDGATFTGDQLKAFEAQAKADGLTNEQANKVLAMSAKNQQAAIQAHWDGVRQWEAALQQDAEFGGSHLEANIAFAKAGIEKFDDGGKVRQLLHETGYGSHPDVVKFFARLGRAHAEDTGVGGERVAEEQPRHERLYGKYNNL